MGFYFFIMAGKEVFLCSVLTVGNHSRRDEGSALDKGQVGWKKKI
jgi:hypothetical protein